VVMLAYVHGTIWHENKDPHWYGKQSVSAGWGVQQTVNLQVFFSSFFSYFSFVSPRDFKIDRIPLDFEI
jgi:hypothetical protein